MNAYTYLQEHIHIARMQVQPRAYISVSALAYPYIQTYLCLYTHTGKRMFWYSQLHLHTKLYAWLHTEMDTYSTFSLSYLLLNWFQPSRIHLCFFKLFSNQPTSPDSHILLQGKSLIQNGFLLLEVTCFHLLNLKSLI